MPRVSRYVQTLNKQQQRAFKGLFDRVPLYVNSAGRISGYYPEDYPGEPPPLLTYRDFRRNVQFSFDCAMVPWCGMWLGIELDGYIHS